MNLLRKLRSGRSGLLLKDTFLSSAKALISVLNEVDQYPALYLNQQVLREAIHRYEHRWVPLLASVSPSKRITLVPPLDVEWVWFCHMLCPVKYITDSAAMLNAINPNEHTIVDHKFLSGKDRKQGIEKAARLWRAMFPNEQFHVLQRLRDAQIREDKSDKEKSATQSGAGLVSHITHDIVAAAERQMAFHYQVAYLPQYKDDKFLKHSVDRYRRMFLKLQSRYPGQVWIPTYDIDLMWHAHMMHPVWYKKSTEKLRGSVLPHDTLTNRSPGSKPMLRWDATTKKWERMFHEPIIRDGGMWRGNVKPDERIARPYIKELIKGVERSCELLSKNQAGASSRESNINIHDGIPFEVVYGGDVNWGNTAFGWVHMTDYRRCNAATQQADDENKIERITFLNHMGQSAVLKGRTIHYVMYNEQGDAYDFRTVIEVFSGASNTPIATAHTVLPHNLCEYNSKASSVCQRLPGEMVLVLRVGGEDFGLLGGNWLGFEAPRKGTPQERVTRGSAGSLNLRLCKLPGKTFTPLQCVRLDSNEKNEKKPGNYCFELPFSLPSSLTMARSSFDLSSGRLSAGHASHIVETYLISMAAAALHVSLQPRFKPENGDKISDGSMYPAWSSSQDEYSMIRGGGGEVKGDNGNWGLWAMLFVAGGSMNWGMQSIFAGSVNDDSSLMRQVCRKGVLLEDAVADNIR